MCSVLLFVQQWLLPPAATPMHGRPFGVCAIGMAVWRTGVHAEVSSNAPSIASLDMPPPRTYMRRWITQHLTLASEEQENIKSSDDAARTRCVAQVQQHSQIFERLAEAYMYKWT